MITSVNNGQVKNIIQLNQKTKARREQGLEEYQLQSQ